MWTLHHSATFKNTINSLPPADQVENKIIDATGLQTLIVKLIWGTRLSERVKSNEVLEELQAAKSALDVANRTVLLLKRRISTASLLLKTSINSTNKNND